ncbi:hypothetical protein [Bradyrhizobium australafricanum]|uniref:hypothetical protein n=1 Tax=Bradyrhizobium australafricanum TaxID=2821406 RepID=UPI001CE288FA|nr:hypothetical protein [Bradyrhizobium australafricanum]MCA6103068.1 hypothetical protein [Bradyrhizobium australafricanum]
MQKIAASFARHGAVPSALCCNISAFGEKNADHQTGTIRAVDSPSFAAVCTARDAPLPD